MPKRIISWASQQRMKPRSSWKRQKTRRSVKSTYKALQAKRRSAVQLSDQGRTRGRVYGATPSDSLYTCLAYSDSGYMTNGPFARALHFRLNSLYDPDAAVGGHQPGGFDELAALYKNYTVYGCAWTLEVYSVSEEAEVFACVQPYGAAEFADANSAMEASNTQSVALPIVEACDAACVKKISGYVDIALLAGLKKKDLLDDAGSIYTALVTGDPAESPLLRVYCRNMDETNGVNVYYRITLKYYAKFAGVQLTAGS